MKTPLKLIALLLAIGASAQTIKSYAEDIAYQPDLVSEQEDLLISLLTTRQGETEKGNEIVDTLTASEKKELIIKNMVHYIRLTEGSEILLEELQRQHFPDLDIRRILDGRQNPGI